MSEDRKVPGAIERVPAHVKDFSAYEGEAEPCELADANVITSLTLHEGQEFGERLHAPVIDVDLPEQQFWLKVLGSNGLHGLAGMCCVWVPSTTEGHGHLYVDELMSEAAMWFLLTALETHGLVEEGFVSASKMRGHTSVRLPWVKKEPAPVVSDAAPQVVLDPDSF